MPKSLRLGQIHLLEKENFLAVLLVIISVCVIWRNLGTSWKMGNAYDLVNLDLQEHFDTGPFNGLVRLKAAGDPP